MAVESPSIAPWQLRQAARLLHAGKVIAYPTESVYGLGCDPLDGAAVRRLLALKRRPMDKGLILIADRYSRLRPFVAELPPDVMERVQASWPGPVTWLLPVRPAVPQWLCGAHASIAVRVTAHPVARALCAAFGGALVSTSANRAGQPPARSPLAVRRALGAEIDFILHGALGGLARPSEIRDALSGRVVRAG